MIPRSRPSRRYGIVPTLNTGLGDCLRFGNDLESKMIKQKYK